MPVKCFTSGLGAVKLIRVAGWNLAPGPDVGGPSSILHDDGASTDSTGTLAVSIAMIGSLNGSRTSPEKLNPEKHEFRYESVSIKKNTENGIYHMIRSFQRAIEVFSKWHIQVLELGSQTFI